MHNEENNKEHVDQDGHFKTFEEYSKTLKGWFIAYGIGAPVLFLTQERITDKIIASGNGKCIVLLFLIGVALQVLIALINKWNNYYLYSQYDNSKEVKEQGNIIQFCCWLSEQHIIDLVIDITTFVLFFIATSKVLLLFT